MIWLLLSALLYAFNNLLWKIFVSNDQPIYLINRRALFTTLFSVVLLLVYETHPLQYLLMPNFTLLLVGCLLGALGLTSLVLFLKTGSLTLVGYYALLGVAITGAYTYLFKNETLTTKSILATTVLLAGYIIYLNDERQRIKQDKVRLTQHLLLALMTIFFSVSTIVKWEVLSNFPTLLVLSLQEIVVLIISFVVLIFVPKSDKNLQFNVRRYGNYALLAVVILAAVFLGLKGLATTNSFITTLTTILVPVLTVVFGVVFMQDKLSRTQIIAFLLIISAELFLF